MVCGLKITPNFSFACHFPVRSCPRDDWICWGGDYPGFKGVIPFWEQRNAAVVVRVLGRKGKKRKEERGESQEEFIWRIFLACLGGAGAAEEPGLAWQLVQKWWIICSNEREGNSSWDSSWDSLMVAEHQRLICYLNGSHSPYGWKKVMYKSIAFYLIDGISS